jgi:lactobin A/cerein 7B family class IIb bacteriocin
MRNLELRSLTEKEIKETNGGVWAILVAAEIYATACAVAAGIGAGVAYIQNHLDKR